tara:strand:- start:328 stop:582 length:255 start_codon:yes stop_codon:yes gene_type:complete
MIDTDKYKKALETPCEYNVSYHSCMQIEELQICGYELLAEVKRLHERLDLAERYIIEPTLIRNYFADVVSKGLDDERDNLGDEE